MFWNSKVDAKNDTSLKKLSEIICGFKTRSTPIHFLGETAALCHFNHRMGPRLYVPKEFLVKIMRA